MSCVDQLVSTINEHNYLILQTFCLGGPTRLTKLKSFDSALKCYNVLQSMPTNLPSTTPYSMVIVLKLSNSELDTFFKTYSYTDVYAKCLKTRKLNYTGNDILSGLLKDVEIWLDEKFKNNCPNCKKTLSPCTKLDASIVLSYPIMVELFDLKRVVYFRMIQVAEFVDNKHEKKFVNNDNNNNNNNNNIKNDVKEIVCFSIIDGMPLEWSNDIFTSIATNTTIISTSIDKSTSKKKMTSKMCCLIHYMWSREMARQVHQTDSCFVRLLSINPSRVKDTRYEIKNKYYFHIKELYEKKINFDNFSVIYPQECNEKIKIIIML
uniref:Wsv267-like protein n=1 Tax=Metapenaeus ensis majanivirus TaxID=2984279 RepID=A0A9C7BI71_9VIRU|nr:MAG: wsv267-like protein [Metapenaeus ensis majanivirus]